jgi:hypothetical protein
MLLQRMSFLEDVKRLEDTETPLSAILIRALAQSTSRTIYKAFVAKGCLSTFEKRENKDRRSGACAKADQHFVPLCSTRDPNLMINPSIVW